MKHLKIRIYGKVQGVYFRGSTLDKAKQLGVAGFVKNQADGSVYAEAEAEEEVLNQFLEWCKKGPMMARVDRVEYEEGPLQPFSQFQMIR
jgi:acylphosphatase